MLYICFNIFLYLYNIYFIFNYIVILFFCRIDNVRNGEYGELQIVYRMVNLSQIVCDNSMVTNVL